MLECEGVRVSFFLVLLLPLDELLDKSYLHVVIYDFAVKMRCEIFAAPRAAAEGLDFGLYYAYVMLCALHIPFIYIALKVAALVFTCCCCCCCLC